MSVKKGIFNKKLSIGVRKNRGGALSRRHLAVGVRESGPEEQTYGRRADANAPNTFQACHTTRAKTEVTPVRRVRYADKGRTRHVQGEPADERK